MEGLKELSHEVASLRKELEELRDALQRGRFLPVFSRRMMTATLILTALAVIMSSIVVAEVAVVIGKIHDIYSLMLIQ